MRDSQLFDVFVNGVLAGRFNTVGEEDAVLAAAYAIGGIDEDDSVTVELAD